MSDDEPKSGEAWMPFLIRKRKFTECMILGWQVVEDGINQMTVQVFELFYLPEKQDPRVDILRDNVGFEVKLKLLKEMGRLSSNDITAIKEFSKERNKLFHGNIFSSPHPISMPEKEKTRLMELADKASRIVANRGFGVWVSKETGDLGNKDVPKPDKHEAVRRIEEIRKLHVPTMDTEETERDVP